MHAYVHVCTRMYTHKPSVRDRRERRETASPVHRERERERERERPQETEDAARPTTAVAAVAAVADVFA